MELRIVDLWFPIVLVILDGGHCNRSEVVLRTPLLTPNKFIFHSLLVLSALLRIQKIMKA